MNHVYPTDIQLMLLRALLSSDQDFSEVWATWKAVCGPYADLDEGSLRLFPLVYTKLSRLLPHDTWLQVARNAYRFHWLRNSYLISESIRVMNLLSHHNIPYVLLKGTAFISAYYDNQSAIRSIDDVDIYIPTKHFFDAVRMIQQRELYTTYTNIEYFDPLFFHEVTFYTSKGILDIHCHPFRTYLQDDDWEVLQRRTWTMKGVEQEFQLLSDTDNFVHLCAYAFQWNTSVNLRWIIDAVTITRKTSLDWERVIYLSLRLRVSDGVYAALSYLQEHAFIEIPHGVLNRLRNASTSRVDRRLYQVGLQDTTANIIAALQLYGWRYIASLHRPFSLLDAVRKLRRFAIFLCQTNRLSQIPGIILVKFWELLIRGVRRSFSV